MTEEEAIRRLNEAAKNSRGDPEAGHGDADQTLCLFLKGLGFERVVKAWDEVEKWYA